MKREVVQEFLNQPGVAGIALMDGRSRPYFFGVDQTLNFQQKEALAQGIQQVVQTTPPGFEYFEFQFSGHRAYIYKFDHGMILLVLATGELVLATYAPLIHQLRAELKHDLTNAIATFRLLAGNLSLSNQNYWQPTGSTGPSASLPSAPWHRPAPLPAQPEAVPTYPPVSSESIAPDPVLSSPVSEAAVDAAALPPDAPAPTLKELLTAVNQISQFTTHYLGPTVVANYWRSSRPAMEWLNNFEIDRAARITYTGDVPSALSQTLSDEQQQGVQDWTHAFIQRCSRVMRDFSVLLDQGVLDDRQKAFLALSSL
ncbi:hypothetical protein [Thermoleptolyngbya sp. C42_A2020_037]|uniref:hypothetical protein n=1 Tax=Thermoleptolyngbya sp. C42_A2020_037 TaxID=2747799 RepID=UPI0019DC7F72|nr:hypothetical protein [Thermoleptolyngbya sp. C42_A2020_037]MBF2084622.1 hypothetical protein [Thermoleptolyngbya sp. C42_A2020_037]